jgi:hypothetical protein
VASFGAGRVINYTQSQQVSRRAARGAVWVRLLEGPFSRRRKRASRLWHDFPLDIEGPHISKDNAGAAGTPAARTAGSCGFSQRQWKALKKFRPRPGECDRNQRAIRSAVKRSTTTKVCRDSGATVEQVKTCEGYVPTALQQRPESVGRCALGIPRKADMPQPQVSRAETVQPRPRPRGPASVAPRSHHGFQHPD